MTHTPALTGEELRALVKTHEHDPQIERLVNELYVARRDLLRLVAESAALLERGCAELRPGYADQLAKEFDRDHVRHRFEGGYPAKNGGRSPYCEARPDGTPCGGHRNDEQHRTAAMILGRED